MTDYVYAFAEGDRSMRDLLGGKGANLAEMTAIGLPVPDGFTITTEACLAFLESGEQSPDGLAEQVGAAVEARRRGSDRSWAVPPTRCWCRCGRARRCRCRG